MRYVVSYVALESDIRKCVVVRTRGWETMNTCRIRVVKMRNKTRKEECPPHPEPLESFPRDDTLPMPSLPLNLRLDSGLLEDHQTPPTII